MYSHKFGKALNGENLVVWQHQKKKQQQVPFMLKMDPMMVNNTTRSAHSPSPASAAATTTTWRSTLLHILLIISISLLLQQVSAEPAWGGLYEVKHMDEHTPKLISQPSLVEKVNNHPNAHWKADINPRFTSTTVNDFKRLLGSFVNLEETRLSVRSHRRGLKLPENFDAREAWPQCSSLRAILDQGHCGSCWAFGATECLSDRFCIHFNETVILSENDLLSCCGFECGNGCNGGDPLKAWQYFVRSGVVTTECAPYFDAAGCAHPGCDPLYPTPQCVHQCKDNADYSATKHYASSAYIVGSDPYDIMAEIYTNGPVEVSFDVFEDFAHYRSGVYHYLYGDYLGGHAVKLLGWGTTDLGIDYWLLANSWNTGWGQDGYFMIKRGENECGIESAPVAGMPSNKRSLIDLI